MKSFLLALAAAAVGSAVGWGASVWRSGWPGNGDPFDVEPLRAAQSRKSAAQTALSGEQPRLVVVRKDDPKEAAPPADADAAAPKEHVFDFGLLPQSSSGEVEFLFRNEGNAPLELKKGTNTCQCTISELAKGRVAPGDAAAVTLKWKTEGPDGPYRHTAGILTNDLRQPEVRLVVTGTITRRVAIEPQPVAFGRFNARDRQQREFTVLAFHSADLQLQELALVGMADDQPASGDPLASHVEFSHKPLSAEELRTVNREAKAGYRATLSLKPGLPFGRFERRIRCASNLSAPTYANVVGTAVGDITVAESGGWIPSLELFNLGNAEVGTGLSKPLFLIVGGANHRDVKLKVKHTLPPELKAEFGAPVTGKGVLQWPLTIAIPPQAPPMSHNIPGEYGKVVLETTHPEYKELSISVSFLVVKPGP